MTNKTRLNTLDIPILKKISKVSVLVAKVSLANMF